MGLEPLLGRTFAAGEDADGAQPVLVLSHAFWQQAFRGDARIVGRQVEMNDRLHTVIGVLPPAPLAYPNPDDVYMPVSSCPFRSQASWRGQRSARGLSVFARLRTGVSAQRALADVQTIGSRLQATYPQAYATTAASVEMLSLRDELTREAGPTFRLLLGTAVFVLLIACANVANLMLAALIRRDRELALRNALGAGRGQLVRQLLTESALLALIGGGLGLALASLSLDMLIAFAERFTPRAHEITIDRTVLAFTFALSMVSGLAFGTVPALQQQNLVVALKDGGNRATSRFAGRRPRTLLIVGQLAVSFMLLIAAGLTLRSLARLQNVDAGFDPDNVLTARLDLNWSKYNSRNTILQFSDRLLARVRALPGVTHAAVAHTFPLNRMDPHSNTFQIRGRAHEPGVPLPVARLRSASADYFAAIGVRLVRGRLYDDEVARSGPGVAVINESLARTYWSDADPIGEQVSGNGGRTWATIIGIVSDARNDGLDRAPAGEAYVPWSVEPWRDLRLVLRLDGDPAPAAAALRPIVKAIDPAQPVTEVRSLLEFRREALASPRLTALLLASFAALALGISMTGLAGVVAFSVSQRTREFGVRIALGADPYDVRRMVVRESMAIVAVSLALGTAGALLFTQMLSGLLFEIEPRDPLTFLSVALVLLAVAAVACFVPARRATLVQPLVALRTS
jgi:predicted permease